MTRTFDPVIEVQKLRDHLSSPDKPLALLLGAGTSCAVEGSDGEPLIPAVAALTDRCREAAIAMGDPYPDAWRLIEEDLPADKRNVEETLSSVRQKLVAILDGDTLAGLARSQLGELEKTIQRTIAKEVRPDPGRFPDQLPHQALGRWVRNTRRDTPVEIFTLNYDTLIERGLEREWVPVFDGFIGAHEPFFSPGSLVRSDMVPGRRWARLWKLHGSVTWALTGDEDDRRIVRGPEIDTGELILPSLRKYEESRKQPYLAMLDRLRGVLTEREEIVLVMVGYSFSDQHINEVVIEALEANPGLHVFALCFSDPDDGDELVEAAQEHRRLVMLAPPRAIVGGESGEWDVPDPAASASRLAGVFEFTGGSGSEGELRLGDFNVLCRLLDAISPADG